MATTTSSSSNSFSSSEGFLAGQVSNDSDFSIDNIPYGVGYILPDSTPRCFTAIGNYAVDLSILQEAGAFDSIPTHALDANVFSKHTLNEFMEHPPQVWSQVRRILRDILSGQNDILQSNPTLQRAAVHDLSLVEMVLPVTIGDYTDFYSSREHATNVGIMFRGKDNALQPNWLHLPVGYHGRSSTVFCTGQPIIRPHGQLQKDPNDPKQGSYYGPCQLMDFELEVAFFVGGPAQNECTKSEPLSMQEAKERIFGFVLMNDWSARDIQKWEYVPLGPFTSKNFATTISPWIVTTEALEAYKVPTSAVQQVNPVPLDYLQDPDYSSYDIQLSVGIQSESMKEPHVVSTSNFANLYWNAAQQLVHHSVTGCIMKAGDLLGSGTISGTTDDSFGSMLELSWKGTKLVQLSGDGTGETRKFLQDGDTVIMKGFCSKPGHGRVGFGECSGKVYPCGSTIDCKARPSATTQQPSRYKDFKLYSLWRSSSSWRVRIALAAKNVSYTTIPISIEQGESQQDWFLQEKNRMGQLPVLEYTDSSTDEIHTLTQSVAIFEFLDCLFPHTKRLFPIDPMDKIGAMELVEIINSGTQPLQNHGTIKFIEETTRNERIVNAFRQDSIRKGLQSIVGKLVKRRRRRLLQQNGPYAMGTFSPTIVDCFLIPQLYNAKRYGVDVDQEFPLLSSIEVACNDHPWFRTTHPSNQPDTPPS